MKANEFVKKFGWDAAKHKADELEIIKSMGDKLSFEDESLKRLVESHELVEKLGGINKAKDYVPDGYKSEQLKQAIADVESCQ